MAEETEAPNIYLWPRKSTSADYTVKIPNFFTLPEYDGAYFKLRSPSFDFANATWCFKFKSHDRERNIFSPGENIKCFDMYIVRLEYEIPCQSISFKGILLNGHDRKYEEFSDDDGDFYESNNEDMMCSLSNERSSFDTRDSLTLIIHLHSESKELDEEQLQITRNRSAEMLSRDFKKLFLNGKNHDLTLRVADKEFRVHQDILAARSPVFEAMLSHDMTEKNKGVIYAPDCSAEAMEQFLFYVYSGKVESLNENNMLGLYYAADKYCMILLKEECSDFIIKSLSPSKVCAVIQLAMDHCDSVLLQGATEYFKHNANEILRTSEWKSFVMLNFEKANELLMKLDKMDSTMAERTEANNISLSPRKSTSVDYIVKIPNFFTLPEYEGTSSTLRSPSFDFANATWCFQFKSHDRKRKATGECIKRFDMHMVRLEYEIPRQSISFKGILLNGHDREYEDFSDDNETFGEVNNKKWMCSLSNKKCSFDTRDSLTLIIHLTDAELKELDEEQLPITTNRSAERLSQDLKKLFVNGKNHDFTLRNADKEFRVHQDILAARSPVFEAKLKKGMTKKYNGLISKLDCYAEAVKQFLFYVYSGKIESLNENIILGIYLYFLAKKFKMILLKKECSEFIIKSLSPSMVCDILPVALKHRDPHLIEGAIEYFKHHANEIFHTPEWESLLKRDFKLANSLLIKISVNGTVYCK